jgi:hypothetical protein
MSTAYFLIKYNILLFENMIVHLIAEVSLEFPYVYTIAVEKDMRSAYQIFSSFLTIIVTQEVMNECRIVSLYKFILVRLCWKL